MSSITDKASFFANHLVLTGKTAELLIALNLQKRDDHQRFVHQIFEPLNLAAAYAMNPVNDDLSGLSLALDRYRDSMVVVFHVLGARLAVQAAGLFMGQRPAVPAKTAAALRAAVAYFQNHLPALSGAIFEAVEYSDERRHAWLQEQTEHETPLTRHRRINKWRTFVRHLDWTACLGQFGVHASATATPNRFATRVGLDAATVLWGQAFAPRAPVQRSESAGSPEALPRGVTVLTIAGGKLEVRGIIQPREFLTDRRVTAALEAGSKAGKSGGASVPADLLERLAPREYRVTCSFLHVGSAVAEVAAWMNEHSRDAQAVRDHASNWLAEVDRSAVMKKLEKHFNKDEQRLLALIFAKDDGVPAEAA